MFVVSSFLDRPEARWSSPHLRVRIIAWAGFCILMSLLVWSTNEWQYRRAKDKATGTVG